MKIEELRSVIMTENVFRYLACMILGTSAEKRDVRGCTCNAQPRGRCLMG